MTTTIRDFINRSHMERPNLIEGGNGEPILWLEIHPITESEFTATICDDNLSIPIDLDEDAEANALAYLKSVSSMEDTYIDSLRGCGVPILWDTCADCDVELVNDQVRETWETIDISDAGPHYPWCPGLELERNRRDVERERLETIAMENER